MTSDAGPPGPDPHHGPDHLFLGHRHDALGRRTLLVVALAAVTMVAEVTAGLWTGSMALLADGLHMATHAGALGLAAAAYAFARSRARDPSFSWGTGKVGDLAGFASALILGAVALGVIWESAGRLGEPVPVAYGEAALVATLGLLVNLASFLILGGHGHHDHDGHDRHGHATDTNHRAAVAHVATDALTSVLALVALGAGAWLGWRWLDPGVGVLGGALILLWAWRLLGEAAGVLLDRADPRLVERVRAAAEAHGAGGIADLHVWRVGPGAQAAILSVAGPADGEALRRALLAQGFAHVTVEVRG